MKAAEKEARRWFLQARDDLQFVEWVFSEGVFFDKGCFLAQQAGEKALKACLYATGQRRVIGHSLFEMVQSLSERNADFTKAEDPARRLDRFYITTRYPNGLPGGSPFQFYARKDLRDALIDLQTVYALSKSFLVKQGVSVE